MAASEAADTQGARAALAKGDSTTSLNGLVLRPAPSRLSRRAMFWLWRLVLLGEKRPLEPEDLPQLAGHMQAARLSERASCFWSLEMARAGARASLARVLWRMMRGTLLTAWVISTCNGVLAAVVRPMILRRVIDTMDDLELRDLLVLAAVLFLEAFCQLWVKQLAGDECSVTLVSACTSLVSKRIPVVDDRSATDTKAVAEAQLVSNDIVRSMENLLKLFHFVSAAVTVICSITTLLVFIGYPSLIGVGFAVLTVLVSGRVALHNKRNDIRQLEAADRRLRLFRQVLDGMHFIKSSAWEESYLQELTRQRADESVHNRRFRTLEMANASLGRVAPPLASMLTFVTMAVLGRPMSPADIFSATSIFMTLRLPLGVLPESFTALLSLHTSIRRVGACLQIPAAERVQPPQDPALAAVLADADFAWWCQGAKKEPVLRGLSLSFRWGTSSAVIGAVGSGKSTLLLGLLGGIPASRGSVSRCQGQVAYIPQRPLVFSGTILSNVLMGHPLDPAKLATALEAAQFAQDLESMPAGPKTEIGERGMTLSGGQQARLNIARAYYHEPRLLVADDPLAALDVHMGLAAFHALLAWKRGGEQQRALIMALNQLAWMDDCDEAVYLEAGSVLAKGTPEELRAAAPQHQQLEELLESARVAVTCDAPPVVADDDNARPKTPGGSKAGAVLAKVDDGNGLKTSGGSKAVADGTGAGGRKRFALTSREHREKGAVRNAVLTEYLIAVGSLWAGIYLACILLAYGLLVGNDVWLAHWVHRGPAANPADGVIYALLGCSHSFVMILCNIASGFAGARAARHLHFQCLSHMLRAPMSYFEETPSGRIINRFSADMAAVDLKLPTSMDQVVQTFAVTCVLFGTIGVVLPWMLVFVVVVGPVYYRLDTLVNRSSRETKRITSNALSPVLTLLQEASSSRVLLRIMERDAWVHSATVERVNAHARSCYANLSLMTFLRLQGSMLGVVTTSLFALLLWAAPQLVHWVPGGSTMIGLAFTYSIVVPYTLSSLSLFLSRARVLLASLERLLEQKSRRVPQELLSRTMFDPNTEWPSQGRLELRSVTLRYRPQLPPAIDGLTLEVPPGTWLGVVGRSGAGKSSLVAMLLRLVELSDGVMLIDGVDAAKVGLQTLRQAIALVPQDPFLLEGPLRKNVDPFEQHGEAALEEALRRVGLDLPLDTAAGKGGGQLSAGQRQLVAVARVTLSRARIVLLDEPTANCDATSDERLQGVARRAFSGCTVLCIAHRLNTILNCDAVLVMEAGRGVEHAPTSELLNNSVSRFARMVAAASMASESSV